MKRQAYRSSCEQQDRRKRSIGSSGDGNFGGRTWRRVCASCSSSYQSYLFPYPTITHTKSNFSRDESIGFGRRKVRNWWLPLRCCRLAVNLAPTQKIGCFDIGSTYIRTSTSKDWGKVSELINQPSPISSPLTDRHNVFMRLKSNLKHLKFYRVNVLIACQIDT